MSLPFEVRSAFWGPLCAFFFFSLKDSYSGWISSIFLQIPIVDKTSLVLKPRHEISFSTGKDLLMLGKLYVFKFFPQRPLRSFACWQKKHFWGLVLLLIFKGIRIISKPWISIRTGHSEWGGYILSYEKQKMEWKWHVFFWDSSDSWNRIFRAESE